MIFVEDNKIEVLVRNNKVFYVVLNEIYHKIILFYNKMKNNAKYMKKVFLKNKCNKNIFFLPDEIIFNILSYLTIKDIFSIRVTCKKLMDLSNFIFPGTIKYMQTIRDYDKLNLIKEIYFVENNIKVEKKSVHINFYEISYEYFSKFK
jgi:hypothetical protein